MGIQRFASCNLSLVNSIHDGVLLASERPERVARGKRSATPGMRRDRDAPRSGRKKRLSSGVVIRAPPGRIGFDTTTGGGASLTPGYLLRPFQGQRPARSTCQPPRPAESFGYYDYRSLSWPTQTLECAWLDSPRHSHAIPADTLPLRSIRRRWPVANDFDDPNH